MKTMFTTLASVVLTCTASTALCDTPAPLPVDIPETAAPAIPQLYYSVTPKAGFGPWVLFGSPYVEATKGQTVHLEFSFVGDPMPTVTEVWRNGRPISRTNPRYSLNVDNGVCSLDITDAQLEDSGVYEFEIKNFYGIDIFQVDVRVLD